MLFFNHVSLQSDSFHPLPESYYIILLNTLGNLPLSEPLNLSPAPHFFHRRVFISYSFLSKLLAHLGEGHIHGSLSSSYF